MGFDAQLPGELFELLASKQAHHRVQFLVG
jgi:hypothetical protein